MYLRTMSRHIAASCTERRGHCLPHGDGVVLGGAASVPTNVLGLKCYGRYCTSGQGCADVSKSNRNTRHMDLYRKWGDIHAEGVFTEHILTSHAVTQCLSAEGITTKLPLLMT